MSSAVMMERTGVGMPGVGVPHYATPSVGTPVGLPTGTNWMVVPRSTIKIEKCTGGLKITCSCDDKLACSMVQNLCTMLAGGMCSCYVVTNGMTVCCCNLTMGMCRYEAHESGVSLTCTSGDTKCCEMIQSCCDCICTLMDAGCTCCVLLNNTPICCGGSEHGKSGGKQSKPSR